MTHKCAIPRCGRSVSEKYLMCGPHWAKVPQTLQNRVWITYFAATRARKGQSLLGDADYMAARSAAINSITKEAA